MTPGKKFFALGSAAAILSAISFFQINSAWADAHHFNTGWTIIGVVLAVATVGLMAKAAKNSN